MNPPASDEGRAQRFFYIGLIVLTLYRVLCLLQPHLVLFYDEAYYYHWSLNLDWGYYSKPPMVAWVIASTTSLLGDTAFAVKLGAPLLYSAAALLVFATARSLWDSRTAITVGWILICMPLVGYNSLFITTDAPLVFFWALTLWLFVFAWRKQNDLRLWLWVGVACGMGMLSKYTMALLPLGLFLFMLCRETGRNLLRTPGPWVAAVVAGLLFGGNIWWNFTHEFAAFRHTTEISGADKYGFYPGELLAFWAAQIGIFGIVWIGALGLLLIRSLRQSETRLFEQSEEVALAFWAFAPLFGVISVQALLSHAFINWAAPAYVGGSLLVGRLLTVQISAAKSYKNLMVAGCGLNLILLSLIYHWPIILDGLNVERSKRIDPYFRVLGWDDIGRQLAPVMEAHPDALLLSNSRKLLAAVGFYAMPGEFRLARFSDDPDYIEDYYDMEANVRDLDQAGQSYIWISENPPTQDVVDRFADWAFIGEYTTEIYSDLSATIHVYEVSGFRKAF